MSKFERYTTDGNYVVDNTQMSYEDIVFADEICRRLNEQDQHISDLEKKLAVAEKALELACEMLKKHTTCDKCCSYFPNQDCLKQKLNCIDGIKDYFKAIAKELKDGKID